MRVSGSAEDNALYYREITYEVKSPGAPGPGPAGSVARYGFRGVSGTSW
jgi:hypothetical protein